MSKVYILKLKNDKYYIGSTDNIDLRLKQHYDGCGSAWTKLHKPIETVEILDNCNKFDEDKYTKIYMSKYGIDNVRGGSYCEIDISKYVEILNREFTHSENLCFKCGETGHYIKNCEETNSEEEEDVWGCSYCGGEFDTEELALKHEKKEHKNTCYRCKREGHYSNSCYAKRDINGKCLY
jgi:hypothetical protein